MPAEAGDAMPRVPASCEKPRKTSRRAKDTGLILAAVNEPPRGQQLYLPTTLLHRLLACLSNVGKWEGKAMNRCPRRFLGCKTTLVLTPVVMLTIAACGESGSAPVNIFCVSDGPTISNVSILPDSAVLGEGGGSINVSVSFDYRTRDGAQLSFIDYRLVDPEGSRAVDESIDIHDQNIQGRGTYTFDFPAPTQTAQNYTLRVRLFDECTERSNWAEVSFNVFEAAGLGSKTNYAVARLNTGLYVIGGRNASGFASDALLHYEPGTGVTAIRASMPEERFSVTVATYDDLIFVFGGVAFGYEQNSVFVYDPRTDSWGVRTPLSRTLSGADAFVLDGIIYVAKDGKIHRYDPVTDIWKTFPSR